MALQLGAPYLEARTLWNADSVKQEAVRTTVDIPTSLYRSLKEQAAAQGRPVRELILAGARTSLVEGGTHGSKESAFLS